MPIARRRDALLRTAYGALLICAACSNTDEGAGPSSSGGTQDAAPPPPQSFAIIGDYGDDAGVLAGTGGLDRVAELVKSWDVDFVITLGDNNYPLGAAETIDDNVGKYFAEFIGDYRGAYGPGSDMNRFWPSPGNHDWYTGYLQPYLDYFTLPANERYYDVAISRIHLFSIDSDPNEPDGAVVGSAQASWLEAAMRASTACFKVVYFHHPPYSSGVLHGSQLPMQWPFSEWGADVVLSGHEHVYERLVVGALPYFVNGLGGAARYALGTALPESQFAYADDFGAQLVTVTSTEMKLEFFAVSGTLIDSYTIAKACND